MINLDGNDVRIDALNEIKRLGLPIFLWGGQVYGEYITEYLRELDSIIIKLYNLNSKSINPKLSIYMIFEFHM